jgi:hypothetical protein
MATATWIRDELEQHRIANEELHHPDAYTAQELAQREHVSGHRVAAAAQQKSQALGVGGLIVGDWDRQRTAWLRCSNHDRALLIHPSCQRDAKGGDSQRKSGPIHLPHKELQDVGKRSVLAG